MRRRSPTNSRPHENRAIRDFYREQNPVCEVSAWLRRNGFRDADTRDESVELNHIFSMGSRPDLWSNMIVLSTSMHRWFHANLGDGRVLCLWRKLVKLELDLEKIRTAAGKRLEGWLAMNEPKHQILLQPWHELTAYARQARYGH